MIIVYTVIFSQIMRSKLPGVEGQFSYSIYLCAGILTWGLFSEITSRSQTMFLDNANLIKKLNFPRLCIPITVILNACLNFSIVFGLFLVFLLISDNFPGWPILSMVPVLMIHIAFATGLGVLLGVLNVFFRDVGQFSAIFLQFWFWLTPIVYPSAILPEYIKSLTVFNPVAPIFSAYQGILVKHQSPQWSALWSIAFLAIALCLFGLYFFRKYSDEMVDEL